MLSLLNSFIHSRDQGREFAYEEEIKTPTSSEVLTPCYGSSFDGSSSNEEPEDMTSYVEEYKSHHWKSLRVGKRCGLCVGATQDVVVNVASVVVDTGNSSQRIEDMPIEKDEMIAISQLGHGSFGRVYLVCGRSQVEKIKGKAKNIEHLTCSERKNLSALKSIPLAALNSKKKAEHVRYERRVVEMLQGHENIIQLRSAWRCSNALYLLTEVAWGGELFRHLQHKRRFEPRQVAFWTAEISSALTHAHTLRICYRDLKPENLLLDARGHIKLVDFGLSKILSLKCVGQDQAMDATNGCRSLCGTPEYMAPETLDRREYGYSVDFWALGMLTAELLSGLPPWYTNNRDELFRRIRFDPLDLSPVVHAILRTVPKAFKRTGDPAQANAWDIANEASDFLSKLLHRNPHQRLGTGREQPSDHTFIQRFYPDPNTLASTIPPYDPSSLEIPTPEKNNHAVSSLYTHFCRVPLISLELDNISKQIANEKHTDPNTLQERSRLVRTWTYDSKPDLSEKEQSDDSNKEEQDSTWLFQLNVQRPHLQASSSLNSSISSSTLSSNGSISSSSPPKRRPTARQLYVSPASTGDE